ncbi:NAD-dependent epimerase/dehydratase family protein [Sphingomonas sp. KC8]|uniref:NAD-dependent epimerase/dehydratase family protein n=1 Tax=Sphingomonas sp. KC8 TaxID=1030157 RepID=UPI000248B211|nr:NAD-dependent epimerase/dehydratase family protein [Sphingomonas sp. KC8]ARS28389.1 hypothetical protein KC8_13980 [Sphingomonas sp. KC8]
MKGNTVLIIGGGGFLGTNLTTRLRESGISVINLSRSWLFKSDDPGVRYVFADTFNREQIEDLVSQSSCVFHMAHGSAPSTSLENMEEDLSASMRLTFALITACAQYGSRLIYLSSGGTIYGPDVMVPTIESAPTHPISPYGAAKLTAEHYLHIGELHHGLDYRVLRISNPYGPWQFGLHRQGVIGTWMRKILRNETIEIWGDGSVVRDYVYVIDVIDAMLATIQHRGNVKRFNIGSGQGHSLKELIAYLRTTIGREFQVNYRPSTPVHVPRSILNPSLARDELGWAPRVELPMGLDLSWQWMQSAAESD